MSSAKVEKKGWTDAEKNALLVALIVSAGPPDWNKVVLPAGRSKQACYHQYAAAVKSAEGTDMAGPPAVIKRRAPRKNPDTNGTTKRKRGSKSQGNIADNEDDEEELIESKKVKQESAKIKAEIGEISDSEGKDGQGENDHEKDGEDTAKMFGMIDDAYNFEGEEA